MRRLTRTNVAIGGAFLAGALVASLVSIVVANGGGSTSSSNFAARCNDSQLRLATEAVIGAGGTDGPTVLIANRSDRACSIRGFPQLSLMTAGGRVLKVEVAHRGSMIYSEPKVRRVVIVPGAVASFAVSYGEEFVPPDDTPARCLAQWLMITLPTSHPKYPEPFEVPTSIDVCLADWQVALTPIERGAQVQGP